MRFGLDGRGEVAASSIICHSVEKINSSGIWFGEDPLSFSIPLLLLQISLISIFTRVLHFLLKPLGQPSIVSQILVGVILGPSGIGRNSKFAANVFPLRGKAVFDTLAVFGFMLFIFLIGVKVNLDKIPRLGKRAVVVGVLAFSLTYILSGLMGFILEHFLSLDSSVKAALSYVMGLQSFTAFASVSSFMNELRILNSEMGRLASSSSVVTDFFYWCILGLKFSVHLVAHKSVAIFVGYVSSIGVLFTSVLCVIRPVVNWVTSQTPEGEPARDVHVFSIMVILMVFGLLGEIFGLNAFVPSFMVGLVIPDGPPLGTALVERLDCFLSVFLMPVFFTLCGLRMDVYSIQSVKNWVAIELVVVVAFFAKIFGTAVAPVFYRMPILDALSLGLIMNAKGVVDFFLLLAGKADNVLNEECFSIMVISTLVIAGVVSPLVQAIYDPSKRFLAYRRRTILHHHPGEELRILACVHRQDNVPGIIGLIAVSNTIADSPINLVILHLVKLVGRHTSLLLPYTPASENSHHYGSNNKNSESDRHRHQRYPTQSERIFNTFAKLEKSCGGQNVEVLQCFKGVSPYATMHNDVCSLALEKRSTLIVLPHYKLWVGGSDVEISHHVRHLNANVLNKAPCSVGILVDRSGTRRINGLLSLPSPYRVGVLFFGGADDREALAYAGRMSKHPHILITLFRFSSSYTAEDSEKFDVANEEDDQENEDKEHMAVGGGSMRSRSLDTEILSKFRLNAFRDERVSFKEVEVEDGEALLRVLRGLHEAFELVVMGRRHEDSSWLTSELGKMKDHGGELGVVGEILARSEVRMGASVLVMQQQTRVWGLRDPEESTRLKREPLKPDII